MRITLTEILLLLIVATIAGYCINFWAYFTVCWSWGLFRAIRYKLRHQKLIDRIMEN